MMDFGNKEEKRDILIVVGIGEDELMVRAVDATVLGDGGEERITKDVMVDTKNDWMVTGLEAGGARIVFDGDVDLDGKSLPATEATMMLTHTHTASAPSLPQNLPIQLRHLPIHHHPPHPSHHRFHPISRVPKHSFGPRYPDE